MKKANTFVREIQVRKLFGYFNYDLHFSEIDDIARLALLYGDNGSGKTTILKLLFHLISPVNSRGHKTVIARTKFQSFKVFFYNDFVVSAVRTASNLVGDVILSIDRKGRQWVKLNLKAAEDGAVKMHSPEEEFEVMRFLKALESLNVEILFMRDNRRLTSSLDPNQYADESRSIERGEILGEMLAEQVLPRKVAMPRSPLSHAVENVETYFREKALTASNQGEIDTNRIYDAIIKHLVSPASLGQEFSEGDFKGYMNKLESLALRNQSFVKVGLASPLLAEDMIVSLGKANSHTRPALMNVLKPFIDSVQARLDALEGIRHIISQFTESLNSFMGRGKSVHFEMKTGLSIRGYDGDPLSPESLSSGEKQLLAMFCHIVCMKGKTAIFMIDEPELSLNVKWQRRIVQSLLDCAEGSSVQFIMASHSMEVLASHRDYIVQLIDTSSDEKKS